MSLWFGSGSEVQTLGDDSNSRQKFQSPLSKTFAWTLKFDKFSHTVALSVNNMQGRHKLFTKELVPSLGQGDAIPN